MAKLKVRVKSAIDPEEEKKKSDKAVAQKVDRPIGKSEMLEGVTTEKSLYERQIPKMVKEAGGKKLSSAEKRSEGIRLGLFADRGGDLVPTSKYSEWQKSGKLQEYGF